MKKYSIDNKNDILKEERDIDYPIAIFITNLQKYINEALTSYIKIHLDCFLDLIVENSTYLTLNDAIIYKPICGLLNIKFASMEKEKQLDYYLIVLKNKLAELSKIQTEEELTIKFPELYDFYTKRKERIKDALDIYGRTYRIVPPEIANSIKKKYLIKYEMDEYTYRQLVMESSYFNVSSFINSASKDITNLINNLPMLLNTTSSFIVDINTLPNIDKNKVSLILR